MENSFEVGNTIGMILTVVVIYLYFKILTTIIYRLIIKPIFKYSTRTPFLLHMLFSIPFAIFPYLFIASYWSTKEQDKVYNDAINNPNDKTVSELLFYCDNIAVRNHPDAWSQLRGMWNVINHSPNVSTDLKRKILAKFMSKGLYINNTNVIDNYKK